MLLVDLMPRVVRSFSGLALLSLAIILEHSSDERTQVHECTVR